SPPVAPAPPPTPRRTAAALARTKRHRLSLPPPSPSRRRLNNGLRKQLGRYLCPKRSSTASIPASTATCAASANCSTTRAASPRVIARQYWNDVGLTIRLGATGVAPVICLVATGPA